jgi:hypothetical protein
LLEWRIRAKRSRDRKVLGDDHSRGSLWAVLTQQPVLGRPEVLVPPSKKVVVIHLLGPLAGEEVAHRPRIAEIELGMGTSHEVLETRGSETTYQRRAQKTPMPGDTHLWRRAPCRAAYSCGA